MPDPENHIVIGRLTRRADFLRAAKGGRWHARALTVQAAPIDEAASDQPTRHEARIGFTLTRKVGCAVVRNRARRRLKEAVRLSPDLPVSAGRDYVIIGRTEALRLSFDRMKDELAQAIRGASKPARRSTSGHAASGAARSDRTRPS